IDDRRALARFAQYLLDHVVVPLVPVPAALELPPVDDVADEIEIARLGTAEELEQRAGLTARRAQVRVRDPDGAEPELAVACCAFVRVHRADGRREVARLILH